MDDSTSTTSSISTPSPPSTSSTYTVVETYDSGWQILTRDGASSTQYYIQGPDVPYARPHPGELSILLLEARDGKIRCPLLCMDGATWAEVVVYVPIDLAINLSKRLGYRCTTVQVYGEDRTYYFSEG